MNSYKRCIGCGVILQSEDQSKLGFVPENVLVEEESILCQRCHQLKNYGKFQNSGITDEQFRKIVSEIKQKNALVILVVDILDLSGSLLTDVNDIVGKNKIIVAANKWDVLPKSLKEERVRNRVKKYVEANGLNNVIDVILVSAQKKRNIERLMNLAFDNSNKKDIYIVGSTNVGKSTLINAIIKKYSDIDRDLVTASRFPGTTLDMIKIELDDDTNLIDTPGVMNRHQITHFVDSKTLAKILPKKEIKQRVYQLNDGQSLFIEKLAIMNFVSGERTSFNAYFSNELEIHRTKLENKDEILENDQILKCKFDAEFTTHKFTLKYNQVDIEISGLGWIRIDGNGQEIEIETAKGVQVTLREALI